MKYKLREQSRHEVTYISVIMSFRKTPSSNSEKSKCMPPSCGTNVFTYIRQKTQEREVWDHSVWQEIRASCITYPSDKWAQHELIQTGQKNSTLHRYQGCGWSISTAVSDQEKTGKQPGIYIFFRNESVLQKCSIQVVPSILYKLVGGFILALRVRW